MFCNVKEISFFFFAFRNDLLRNLGLFSLGDGISLNLKEGVENEARNRSCCESKTLKKFSYSKFWRL